MKKRGKLAIWPVYLDSGVSRRLGRKIPKKLAVPSPKLEEMVKAAKRLKLSYEVVPDAAHPRTHWRRTGYLLVEKRDKKTKILRAIAREIRVIRGELRKT